MTAFLAFGVELLNFTGGFALLFHNVIHELRHHKIEGKLLSDQIMQIGVRSLPLIAVTTLSTGMVMTLQFGISLSKYGGAPHVPKFVALSIAREMGPVFTSLMIAARVGAGITSEIGAMMVTQQVDAIRALGTSPISKIVIPRVLGCIIVLPLMAAMGNIISVTGALVVGVTELNLDPNYFIQKVLVTVRLIDFMTGSIKTLCFAFMISFTACYFGLNVKEGAKEVGSATTKSVVYSSIMILVGDFFITKALWFVETLL